MKRHIALITGLACAALLAACVAPPAAPSAGRGDGIVVADAWARAAVTGNSAAYMILRNEGPEADRLIRAECDAAAAVELHQTTMEGGMMKMALVDGIVVSARGQTELKPAGLHIMLIGLKRELKAGEKLALKLHFEKAGTREITVEVRQ